MEQHWSVLSSRAAVAVARAAVTIACLLAGAAAAPAGPASGKPAKPAAGPPAETVVYRSAFEAGKTDGWSSDKPLAIDQAKGMLHPVYNQAVRLALPELPPHRFLRLRMDLYVIDSWDGMGNASSPDRITISLAGGPTLLDATFAITQQYPQAYPDNGSWARHPARTGEAKALAGYRIGASLYRLEFTFPHAEPKATLELAASLVEEQPPNRTAANESCGVGGVVVSVLADAPVQLGEKRFAELWARLAGTDAVKANEAVWTLAAAGPAAVPYLGRAYGLIEDPALAKRVGELIRRLDADDWRRREQATQQLISLGPRAHAQLRAALAANPSPEVKSRIEHILSANRSSGPKQVSRLARARWVLQVIGGREARAMLSKLPKPAKPKPPRDPRHQIEILEGIRNAPVILDAARRRTRTRRL